MKLILLKGLCSWRYEIKEIEPQIIDFGFQMPDSSWEGNKIEQRVTVVV